jgi:hypothetical protein
LPRAQRVEIALCKSLSVTPAPPCQRRDHLEDTIMARKYSKSASKDVERAMDKRKKGTLKSGKGGKGGTVKSRKQAIAIGLSEARKKGKKVPAKRK